MKALPEPAGARSSRMPAPRQLAMVFEGPQLWMLEVTEQQKIVVCLANVLLQAAGEAVEEESSDDER
jgi:hypothetical protein